MTVISEGNGFVSCSNNQVRNGTKTFKAEEGSSFIVTAVPDEGYRVKFIRYQQTGYISYTNDYTDKTSISQSQTVNNIKTDVTFNVEFEKIENYSVTSYNLSITARGNGTVSYSGNTIRGKSSTFSVGEGSSATLLFKPDNGYMIKTLKMDNSDVTSKISNNSYTIREFNKNTTVEVVFEGIVPTYNLSIKSAGNGSLFYNGMTIRNETSSFTVNEGTSATITFTPDSGYRIKSVKVNGATVSLTNYRYTISSISSNTTVIVEFEEIPPTTYTLSITAIGNGYATYNGTTVRGTTSEFDVTEGTSATITFTADIGYQIKSVKVNGATVSLTNYRYTVSSISANTTISVEFEEIPPTTYTLSITATGNGSAAYNGTTVRGMTSAFDVTEGTSATITFTPDNGYRIKSVKVNGATVSVTNNQYTISSISANTTISVEFEEIPPTIYTLSITATGNGSAAYNGTTVRSTTRTFDVTEGTTATITFTPDNGYRIKTVKVNGATVSLANNQSTISSINVNTTVEVTFAELPSGFTGNDLNYTVTSFDERQVKVTGGNYGIVLTVPATVTYQDETWKVVGIESGMLANNSQLAAVIWEPEVAFTESVSNPNLLLYVKSADYAPVTIRNVVVNGTANNIILTDATNGNDFYCPQAFTASRISYTHNYSMATGIGESKGWESIALPFDVAKTTHASKGEIVPYQKWDGTDSKKPYWLMELGAGGFVNANAIKANTPYIISMPNHSNYREDYRLNGSITFSAENVRVKRTDDLSQASSGDKTFVPNFANRQGTGVYALNVNSDYVTYTGGLTAGSRFVPNLRTLHPFEAYMTSTATTRMPIVIGDNMATGIAEVPAMMEETVVRVYLPSGQLVVTAEEKHWETVKAQLPAGLYIVNGQKLIVK